MATNGKIEFESSPNQRTLKLIVKTLEGMFATESKTIASNVEYHFIEWPLGPLPPQCTGMAGVNCCAFGRRGSQGWVFGVRETHPCIVAFPWAVPSD